MSITQKKFLTLLAPIFIQMMFILVTFLTDIFFFSTLSDAAVAGSGATIPLLLIGISLLSMISNPSINLLSRYISQGKKNETSATFMAVLKISLFMGGINFMIMLIIFPYYGSWLGLTGEALRVNQTYLLYAAPFFLLDPFNISLKSLAFSYGRVKTPLYAGVCFCFVNLALNFSLYLNIISFIDLNTQTIAISTLIAEIIGLMILFYGTAPILFKKLNLKKIDKSDYIKSRNYILNISYRSFIDPMSQNASYMITYALLAWVSIDAVSGYTYAKNITLLISVCSGVSIGVATQIVISHFQGLNQLKQASWRMTKSLMIFLPIVMGVIAIMFFNSHWIVSIFTKNPEVIKVTNHFLLFMIFYETIKVGNMIIIPSLYGSGDIMAPVMAIIMGNWLINIGLSYYFLTQGWGIYAIMIGLMCDEFLRFLFNLYRWYGNFWIKKSQTTR